MNTIIDANRPVTAWYKGQLVDGFVGEPAESGTPHCGVVNQLVDILVVNDEEIFSSSPLFVSSYGDDPRWVNTYCVIGGAGDHMHDAACWHLGGGLAVSRLKAMEGSPHLVELDSEGFFPY